MGRPTIISSRAQPHFVALQHSHTSIAADSSSALHQIRNQLLKPMDMFLPLHAHLVTLNCGYC
eukprot:scaffold146492_cov21-Tisochrysis_lutea.AAC.1